MRTMMGGAPSPYDRISGFGSSRSTRRPLTENIHGASLMLLPS